MWLNLSVLADEIIVVQPRGHVISAEVLLFVVGPVGFLLGHVIQMRNSPNTELKIHRVGLAGLIVTGQLALFLPHVADLALAAFFLVALAIMNCRYSPGVKPANSCL